MLEVFSTPIVPSVVIVPTAEPWEPKVRLTSVSYTHLDVYKRQVVEWSVGDAV